MHDRQPSQMALAAAAARAAHLVVDREPLIFRDPVAADLIGEPGAEMVGYHRRSGDHIVLAGTRTQVTGPRSPSAAAGPSGGWPSWPTAAWTST
jgi:O-methyltransferase involved in polyketide biosynthesis